MKRHRESEEVFECRSCKRKFSSFQALGGHRASHKRVKLEEKEHHLKAVAKSLGLGTPSEGFSLGQALEGHMRRHRAAASNEVFSSINQVVAKVSVLKRSCNAKVFCLDLNLTPLQNDLNFLLFGKVSPKINLSCF